VQCIQYHPKGIAGKVPASPTPTDSISLNGSTN
jgi:hypothetical protein